ncbi:transcription termination/antitermination protein NusG [Roseimaritima ulvae]|uniref:Transcriptional activator RfaH n=1 Tax=Roseimaritima ulvae TaxID=980254 RepID=A0A5B9QHV5_9BACT|nr:transcription termination/antitermination NusG family protein [Roseimaritima ulvae]QEG38638.1 transcriptional activator RfaH [Roseimaritima ulvae]
MPLLPSEPDMFPEDLLDTVAEDAPWWAIYTRSRQEKALMRQLQQAGIPFYGPVIERRYRSPAGRVRTSYTPLFSNYVFLQGDEEARYQAVCTGCVSRCVPVDDPARLVTDLRQVHALIMTKQPLSPEARIEPGDVVRIKNGQFAGFEGRVSRREHEVRLVIDVQFMNQGVSVALDDCQMEVVSKAPVE